MTLPALSLRGKLYGFAALLILVPGVLLGLLAERNARESLSTVIGRQLDREALYTAERLSTLLRGERATLQSFAMQDLMREILVADIDKRIAQALATLRDGRDTRLGYLVVDHAGAVVAASSAAWLGDGGPWRDAVADAFARPGTYRGPFTSGRGDDDARALVVATRVPDPDAAGASLGTLVGLVDWRAVAGVLDEVREELATQGVPASLALVDGRGDAIARVGDDAPAAVPDRTAAGVDPASIVGSAPLAPDVPPWRVLVAEPTAHALAPAGALARRLALTTALALGAALVVATFAARRVVRPLSELTDAIRRMTVEDIADAGVPVRSDDEVGVLARSFNDMAADLHRMHRELVDAEKFAFVGELASGVAHEVRTSLGVLRTSAQMLEKSLARTPGSEIAELVGMIREEVGRLAGVVDDLLTLDRPRELQREPTPLSAPLARAAEFTLPKARERGVTIDVQPAAVDPIVSCDRDALQHVCVNLLLNAVQALERGGTVEIAVEGARDGYGTFRVSDDGPGIADALRDRIFDPFVTGREAGVGLGLTFVKRAVQQHGGRVAVAASPSGGACFRVAIPLAEDAG